MCTNSPIHTAIMHLVHCPRRCICLPSVVKLQEEAGRRFDSFRFVSDSEHGVQTSAHCCNPQHTCSVRLSTNLVENMVTQNNNDALNGVSDHQNVPCAVTIACTAALFGEAQDSRRHFHRRRSTSFFRNVSRFNKYKRHSARAQPFIEASEDAQ